MSFFVRLQSQKNYLRLLRCIKSGIAFVVICIGIFTFVKSAGVPLTGSDIYSNMVTREYDISRFEEVFEKKDEAKIQEFRKEVENIILKVENHMHGVGDNVSLDWETQTNAVCEKYRKRCDILYFDEHITPKSKYTYTLLSAYLLDALEKNLTHQTQKLSNVLKSLTLRTYVSKDPSHGVCYTERRGCADHTSVIINLELIKSPAEYANILVHEIGGHIVDLGVLTGFAKKLSETYTEFGERVFSIDDPSIGYYQISRQGETVRKKGMKKEDFCSLYSMTNMFEDFAECALMFQNHNAYFRELAQTNRTLRKKFMWFANLYANGYIFANPKKAVEARQNPTQRVRDMTKVTSN